MLNALRAAAVQKFGPRAAYISRRLGDSRFLMADETPVRIGKNRGYAWVFIGQYDIKVVVAPSQGRIVLDMHCPHFHIPVTVDGYAAYGAFGRIQRCWGTSRATRSCWLPGTAGARPSCTGASSPRTTAPRGCRLTPARRSCRDGRTV